MTKLYEAFTKYKLTVYMFGDTNQCDPVEPGGIIYDYFTSIPITEMCPRRVEMKYIEEYARYDPQTRSQERIKGTEKASSIHTLFHR